VRGFAVGGICLIWLREIRPDGWPAVTGLRSDNAAHRIAVEWDDNGQVRTGLYIPRRDTSSMVNALLGGRMNPACRRTDTHLRRGQRPSCAVVGPGTAA
jgi:hypothetical protein